MGYVVGLGLQNLELKILFQLDIRFADILNVKVQLPIRRLIAYA